VHAITIMQNRLAPTRARPQSGRARGYREAAWH
jgi:hypothetical protein